MKIKIERDVKIIKPEILAEVIAMNMPDIGISVKVNRPRDGIDEKAVFSGEIIPRKTQTG